MKAEDLFHLGIVTDDPRAARDELSALLGYEWGPQVGGAVDVTLPDGDRSVDLQCSYSVTEPRIEIVSAVPDTPLWAATSGIHHLGYWSDDVESDCRLLEKEGFVVEATRALPDGGMFFAFARSRRGVLVELVTRTAESGLSRCWATS